MFATGKPQLSDSTINKGKSIKLALISVCNKLLKQAFAIANSRIEYDLVNRNVLPIVI